MTRISKENAEEALVKIEELEKRLQNEALTMKTSLNIFHTNAESR